MHILCTFGFWITLYSPKIKYNLKPYKKNSFCLEDNVPLTPSLKQSMICFKLGKQRGQLHTLPKHRPPSHYCLIRTLPKINTHCQRINTIAIIGKSQKVFSSYFFFSPRFIYWLLTRQLSRQSSGCYLSWLNRWIGSSFGSVLPGSRWIFSAAWRATSRKIAFKQAPVPSILARKRERGRGKKFQSSGEMPSI